MEIKLHNTLTGKKEVFKPIKKGLVSMYNCGPTVYDFAHIGNLRAYVVSDVIRRTFECAGYTVRQVINVTDIGHLSSDSDEGEDKMTKGLRREGMPLTLDSMRELSEKYFKKFENDLENLNIQRPEKFPFASEHIKEDVQLVETLETKGFVYKTSDGLYFDTSKDKTYGKLNNINSDNSETRIGENSEKKSPKDFALWKYNNELGFDSPFGKGFPGWHIECSAMSMKYLGETFDIHTGGIEHIPVHHNNEIAQSECATGKPLANYWIHHNHMTVDGKKMAKSEGTGFTLDDLIKKGIHPLSYKYWLLTAHYRSAINFTWETVLGAQTAFEKIIHGLAMSKPENQEECWELEEVMSDNFDTPKAIAYLNKVSDNNQLPHFINNFDEYLGLDIIELADRVQKLSPEVKKLVDERNTARENSDFQRSDDLREQVQSFGYEVYDTPQGSYVLKRLAFLI